MAKACREVAQAWMRIMRDTENDLPPERAPILDLTASGAIANDQPFFTIQANEPLFSAVLRLKFGLKLVNETTLRFQTVFLNSLASSRSHLLTAF
jgi:hypothetical protein